MFRMPTAPARRLCAIALGFAALAAQAQPAFPSKPITLIVPFAAGGSTDVVARLVGEHMGKRLGQTIIVDNRAGAGGMLGTDAVARARPDGYTIGMATVSTMAVNPVFFDKAAASNKQLLPLINLVSIPSILVANPSLPVKDFQGLVAEIKKQPAGASTPVPGIGSLGHLFIEAFADAIGAKIVPVPYKGMGAAQTDVISGLMPWMLDQAPSVLPHVKAGKLKPLAVVADQRLPELPNVPTFKELGHAELNEIGKSWFGIVIPAKTPPEVADKLRDAAQAALKTPELQARLTAIGAIPTGTGSAEFRAQIDAQLERNRAVAKRADIKVE
ncbi:MAG TPA: tripartite tricarboxylate transporter substrate-binding protein [Rubrivivax sp.]|nr:ABC transporter substrate-binding protein [Pseudomonadota bacterium]MCW5639342.1 ABC transporter substrate-binding protein [Rubrivivax sp.]HRY89797.1 tripartite tricarboxylate transporter substrate-binding protein [Rubrivivax sp.]HRZ62209.1 tripartite tricarboxylate transporter substrate-binding protein [Rubrivivax sp.]